MRALILGLIVFCCWAFFARWYYVCQIKHLCADDNIEEPIASDRLNDLGVALNGTPVLSGYDQFAVVPGSDTISMNANNDKFVNDLAAYMAQNPDAKLKITGNFMSSEGKPTSGFFENWGLVRADAIKKQLVAAGVNADRINIDYNETEDLNRPLGFALTGPAEGATAGGTGESDDDEAAGSELEVARYTFKDMNFSDANFELASATFRPGPQFKEYADSAKVYLDRNPKSKLTIIGHTCDLGSDKLNESLGRRRAKAAREYLRSVGIDRKRINVNSKGESSPAYPNDAEPNRSKNRRINVKITD